MEFYILNYLLILLALAISGAASAYIHSAYRKYKNKDIIKNITGREVARMILDKHNLQDVKIFEVKSKLADHYDPAKKIIKLSSEVYNGTSIASVAIAAHEVGHAVQDKESYAMMRFRSFLVPFVSFSTNIGYFVFFLGLMFGAAQIYTTGIILISAMLLFQLVTLPVEFDASKRAKNELEMLNILAPNEKSGVEGMLFAAAMTYVAGVLSSIVSLVRLILIAMAQDD